VTVAKVTTIGTVPGLTAALAARMTGRPLRAACIGTSVYAGGSYTADNVSLSTASAWDYTKMGRYMQGRGTSSWFTWACLLSNGRMLPLMNAAESGSMLASHVSRISRDVLAHRPDIVFLGDPTNDINGGETDANIRARVASLVAFCKAANVTPILVGGSRRSDVATKNQRTRNHNEWARRYASSVNVPYIDPFAAIVDPALSTGYPAAAYMTDTVHPNIAGAKVAGQRAVDALDGILNGIPTGARSTFIAQEWDTAPNLFLNPLFVTDANADSKADSWGVQGTGTLDTDARVLGKLQSMSNTANGQIISYGFTPGGGSVSVGDRLAISGLAEVTAAAGSLNWAIYIQSFSQTGAWASNVIGYGGGLGSGVVGIDLPLSPFYIEITVPTGSTLVRFEARACSGTGTISLAQMKLVNLTALGIDSIY
jgi:hypothetical protein